MDVFSTVLKGQLKWISTHKKNMSYFAECLGNKYWSQKLPHLVDISESMIHLKSKTMEKIFLFQMVRFLNFKGN
jgi:hypothetical protein